MRTKLLMAALLAALVLSACGPAVGTQMIVAGQGCTHPNPDGDEWIGSRPAPQCWDATGIQGVVAKGGGENASWYPWTWVRLEYENSQGGTSAMWVDEKYLIKTQTQSAK